MCDANMMRIPSTAGFQPLHRYAWYRRAQAWALTKGDARYDAAVEEHKRALFGTLEGDVLEIGPGAGRSLRYFRGGARWLGIEPNVFAHEHLLREAGRLGMEVEVRAGTAERLPVADASMDAVASSLVLCSVTDLEAALREIVRVLRPGGRFVFIEHVAAPRGTWMRRFQRLMRAPQRVIGDGCHPDRETWTAIERAGFRSVDLTYLRMPIPLPVLRPHIVGTAVR
jgi:ubiquinone/menaquinone biosynthesis C-methylase UbiE